MKDVGYETISLAFKENDMLSSESSTARAVFVKTWDFGFRAGLEAAAKYLESTGEYGSALEAKRIRAIQGKAPTPAMLLTPTEMLL